MTLTTKLDLLHHHHACAERYAHLLTALSGPVDHNLPINLLTILDSNGPDDVEWVLFEGATVEECGLLYADYQVKRGLLYADYEAKRVLLLRGLLA